MRKTIFVLGLLLFAIPASTFANDLHQDLIIYDFKDFAVFTSHWMDINCSLSDWCNGCDFDMSDSVDVNDLWDFADDWLFITAEDVAAIAARDAADAGLEHAVVPSGDLEPDGDGGDSTGREQDAAVLGPPHQHVACLPGVVGLGPHDDAGVAALAAGQVLEGQLEITARLARLAHAAEVQARALDVHDAGFAAGID